MAKVIEKISWNSQGFKDILMSEEINAELEKVAKNIESTANSNLDSLGKKYAGSTGYKASVRPGTRGRSAAYVSTTDIKSKLGESYHQCLKGAM